MNIISVVFAKEFHKLNISDKASKDFYWPDGDPSIRLDAVPDHIFEHFFNKISSSKSRCKSINQNDLFMFWSCYDVPGQEDIEAIWSLLATLKILF